MKFYKIIGTVSLFIPEGRFKDIARKFYHLKILKKKIYAANTHEGLILYINDKKYYFEYSYLGIDISNLEISAIEGYFSRYLPKEGDIVIDVGAYRGVISLIMSKLVGEGGRVISFEPDPFNYKLLFDNKKRLNIKNLIIIDKCLIDRQGTVDFYSNGGKASSIYNNNQKKIKVKASKLDVELKKLNISKINFLKVDVEGAEIDLLKGAENILRNSDANIAVASYHIINGERTNKRVEDILKNYGYQTASGNKDHLTTYGWK